MDLDADGSHRPPGAGRIARRGHLERGALVSSETRNGRRVARSGRRGGNRRVGGQLERRHLPDAPRFDRASGRRARARGDHAARPVSPMNDRRPGTRRRHRQLPKRAADRDDDRDRPRVRRRRGSPHRGRQLTGRRRSRRRPPRRAGRDADRESGQPRLCRGRQPGARRLRVPTSRCSSIPTCGRFRGAMRTSSLRSGSLALRRWCRGCSMRTGRCSRAASARRGRST